MREHHSVAGLLSHLSGTNIDWALTAVFATTAISGSLLAGHFGTATSPTSAIGTRRAALRVDTSRLQRWFGYLVFAVATYILVDSTILH